MRIVLIGMFLAVGLLLATPASAQLRENLPTNRAPARLFDDGAPHLTLNKLFSPQHFRMSHSYEMSMGGGTSSLGMYTNSMQWQFSDKLAARMDVAFAHTPLGGGMGLGDEGQNGRFFLRNAEVAYRPTENTTLHLSFQQSPYGGYMSPYGYMPGGFGYDRFGYDRRAGSGDLFFRDGDR